MRLRAKVRTVTGGTVHWRSDSDEPLATPVVVEIEGGDGGFYVFRLDADGACISDTWHESLERAKAQAQFEYKIDEDDWSVKQ